MIRRAFEKTVEHSKNSASSSRTTLVECLEAKNFKFKGFRDFNLGSHQCIDHSGCMLVLNSLMKQFLSLTITVNIQVIDIEQETKVNDQNASSSNYIKHDARMGSLQIEQTKMLKELNTKISAMQKQLDERDEIILELQSYVFDDCKNNDHDANIKNITTE